MQAANDVKKARYPLRALSVRVGCKVPASFRVEQVRGMFDLPAGAGKEFAAHVQVPEVGNVDGTWRIGAIVMLTAVGFSSPPAWLRPYGVLSNGEKFRCDLARSLLDGAGVVAFDEFTSVVDRTVAKVGSLAVAKAIRAGRCDGPKGDVRRFVAVTCHYDVLAWLQPDWILDMASGRLARGALCRRKCGERPALELRICRCGTDLWPLFARHHYLSSVLHRAAVCYVAVLGDVPVAFCATLHATGHAGHRNISRLVVLPDYQGIGIGRALLNAVAERTARRAVRVGLVTSHPGMIAAAAGDGRWRLVEQMRHGNARHGGVRRGATVSTGRPVCRFVWVGITAA